MEALAEISLSLQDGGGGAMTGLPRDAKESFHVAKRRFRGSICKEPVAPGRALPKRMSRSMDRWG